MKEKFVNIDQIFSFLSGKALLNWNKWRMRKQF